MYITRAFQCGNSQAVRIPKEFQFGRDEVLIFRDGADIVLRPKPPSLASIIPLLQSLSFDFSAE